MIRLGTRDIRKLRRNIDFAQICASPQYISISNRSLKDLSTGLNYCFGFVNYVEVAFAKKNIYMYV